MATPRFRRFKTHIRATSFQRDGVKSLTSSTVTITRAANAGRTNVFNLAAGVTATLPAATGSGDVYRFVFGTLATGDHIVKVADATDVFRGGVLMNDIGDSSAATADFHPTASTSDTITFTAAIGSGKVGDWVEFEDIATNTWVVRGSIQGVTDPTTPFSATVS